MPRVGFCAVAASIFSKLPAGCALLALARRRRFAKFGTAACRRIVSASWERCGEDCISARPNEAIPRFRRAAGLYGCERHLPRSWAEDASRTDSRPRFRRGGRQRTASEHAGFDALERVLDRRDHATPLGAAVSGITPNGGPGPLMLSARPLWWTEGTPRAPFAPSAILAKPAAAILAGVGVPQAGCFGLR